MSDEERVTAISDVGGVNGKEHRPLRHAQTISERSTIIVSPGMLVFGPSEKPYSCSRASAGLGKNSWNKKHNNQLRFTFLTRLGGTAVGAGGGHSKGVVSY